MKFKVFQFVCFQLFLQLSVEEPISLTAGLIGAGSIAAIPFVGRALYCKLKECCQPPWTNFKVRSLYDGLQASVFGQHVAIDVVYNSIRQHVLNENPRKALVLSFHGWRGTGKTHVSDILVRHLYKLDMNSKYVHKVIATHEFLDPKLLPYYKRQVKEKITKAVTNCERSLFIFDEIEKMPPGLIDVIKPYIDYHHKVDGVDYRKSIFILLGNIGAKDINQHMLKHIQTGKEREKLTVKETHHLLSALTVSRYGGLEGANIVQADLIDWFVPFLPLERKHVKMCAETELRKLSYDNLSDSVLEEIADEVEYLPSDTKIFSATGCKRIDRIVERYIGRRLNAH